MEQNGITYETIKYTDDEGKERVMDLAYKNETVSHVPESYYHDKSEIIAIIFICLLIVFAGLYIFHVIQ